jgi:hypothetical protein
MSRQPWLTTDDLAAIIPTMATEQILQMLRAERDRLNVAIEALSGGTTTKRRGRPAGSKNAVANAPDWVLPKAKPAKQKGRREFTPAQRAEQSRRAKAMWRKRKAAAKKPA